MAEALLFMRAFMGHNKTSDFYRKRTTSGFKKLRNDREMQKVVDIFNISNSSQDSNAATGEQFIVHLYGGKRSDGLDKTRYKRYIQTVDKKDFKLRHESCVPSSYVSCRPPA
ncbi:hypothetical protein AVEN_25355-1 [Araneus ventricosus]|uniref:Uncharacterized protein n=1 Tax=Araneus ventricosus TaxID=182803 RepID=A0A4Y2EHJ5_ARAVE|nr:hypothetical protein AVEN_25355-1 [Araneus ventricosus]